jgi:hypothetical protein
MKTSRQRRLDRDEPDLAVHDEEDRVRLRHRRARLGLDGRREAVLRIRIEPGRVDEQDPAVARDLDLLRDRVPGDPGLVLDQGAAEARIAVEERRLADVGATDDRHDRELRRR